LDLYQKEMFLFPRACRICFRSQDQMYDCLNCYSISYCSEQHMSEDIDRHAESCRQLRIAMLADTYESCVSVGMPVIPSEVDKKHLGSASDMSHFIVKPKHVSNEISKEELDYCFLSCQVSGALTLFHTMTRWRPTLPFKDNLVIHIAGASTYEMMGLIKWEYLIHRLPDVKMINFSFVGPDLMEEEDTQPEIPPCPSCMDAGRAITYSIHPTRYQNFVKTQHYTPPDLVLVQNCGFAEFSENSPGWEEGWRGLEQLLPPSKDSLLAFTSYTKGEANKDLERFLSHCRNAEVLMSADRNSMSSSRPCRDWEMDQNKDIFFSNQYMSVVTAKE